jgi:hypothetical protein
LLQYLELLTSPAVIQSQDYAQKVVPTLAELGEKYGICRADLHADHPANIAFQSISFCDGCRGTGARC